MRRRRELTKAGAIIFAFLISACAFAPAVILLIGASPSSVINLAVAVLGPVALIWTMVLLRNRIRVQERRPALPRRPSDHELLHRDLEALAEWDGLLDAETERFLREGTTPPRRYP